MSNFQFMHIVASIISCIGFCIFVWWWKTKRVTIVYAYTAILFLMGSFISIAELIKDFKLKLFILEYNFSEIISFLYLVVALCIVSLSIHKIYLIKRRLKLLNAKREFQSDETFAEEILIVDDNQAVIDLLKRGLLLAFPNLKIHESKTGEQALKLFNRHKNVNLIITDLYMPKMNGFELCEIIKYKCPWTIVIAITGYPLKYEFMKVKEVGFDDYIEKPFPIKVIVGIVRRELHRIVAWKTIQGETKTT